MKSSFAALVLASLSVAVPVPASAAAAAPTAQQNPASAALAALFKTSDEDSLRRNPINALSRGDLRYAGELGDYPSDVFYDAERKAARDERHSARGQDASVSCQQARLRYLPIQTAVLPKRTIAQDPARHP